MTEHTVSNKDAFQALEVLSKYCVEHDCVSCSMIHICSRICHADYTYLADILDDAARSITRNWEEDDA